MRRFIGMGVFALGILAGAAVGNEVPRTERGIQSRLLRDIFGPIPFCAVTLNPAWLEWSDESVIRLAEGIYRKRTFKRVSILGDALEETECDNRKILEHCREQKVHVRGFWMVDLTLGKL